MKQIMQWCLAIALCLGLILWVQYDLGWNRVLAAWQLLPPAQVGVFVCLTLLSYLLRAYRVFYLLGRTAGHPFPSYIRINFLHNALNILIPMRLGEASFPVLMKRTFAMPYSQSAVGLLWLRLMDLHWLLLLLSLMLCISFGWIFTLLPVALLMTPVLALHLLHLHRNQLISSDLPGSSLRRLVVRLLSYPVPSNAQLTRLYLMTAGLWSLKLAVLTLLMLSFVPIAPLQCLLAVISADISSVLPIHGLGGSGTFEAAMVFALAPFGVATSTTLLAAVNVHIYMLSVILLTVPIALLITPTARGTVKIHP
ncbi:lysylphosphatidylglycerol synthase transmembrane domain-containing protein [Pokkaliibacter sp. MBI-7]|uniref:lysylphosphatidylglycerol synthase transmembrane domain-containing protein n=1 Tax=Pokkaliibacter sp. MBI-7 TaxID=3040600 RepID=UPI002448E2E3|nr:lysylphosphatidylglycerol synthase transmembrane domain-containing protein [Pokkaliibacter sp. MBI-7]MDH2435817.1 lysylphosphatidylglycerol synthase transmembrane domain-containing protein [Pokkaliibacter sp. MBI-7]